MQTNNLSAEQYEGVKFKTVIISDKLPETDLYKEFIYWCKTFSEKDLAPEHETGSFGNMSFRFPGKTDQFIITRTGAPLGNISKNDFVQVLKCDLHHKSIQINGTAEPSSETFIHAQLYRELPSVNAIFHGHSEHILQNSSIPCTQEEIPYGTTELMKAALNLKQHPVFNLKNHGFFSTANCMDKAGKQIITLL